MGLEKLLEQSERRCAELGEALRQSEERFRVLADNAPVMIWSADTTKECTWVNRRWTELTGQTVDAAAGAGWTRAIHPDDLKGATDAYLSRFDLREPFTREYRLRRADGEYRWALENAGPVYDAQRVFTGYVGACADVTHYHDAQAEMRQAYESERAARTEAERTGRMKDDFLSTLSHELRTPLNAILGWSQMLSAGAGVSPADVAEGLATIERNARAQSQLIEDLLDMSRIISGRIRLDVQRVDVASVIRAAVASVQPAAEAKELRVQTILDPHAGPVSGDPARLQQVFWNLLANAVKFTPRGGRIQVVLERVNSHLEIAVSDTGQGIRPEFLPHVFDRFRQGDHSAQRAAGGLGIGLSLVKHLVELHGGGVRARSPGEHLGATFVVALPLAVVHEVSQNVDRQHPQSPQASPSPDIDLPSLAGLTVLVVDDEPDARELLRRVLERRRATVLLAPNAAEALEAVRRLRPDVMVSDIGMPGMDGYELIRLVRSLPTQQGGKTPALALTAFARSEDRRRAMLAGFQIHLSKPVEPPELVATVASLAGRTGAPA
jgi:PAS domain S-box-containing protein